MLRILVSRHWHVLDVRANFQKVVPYTYNLHPIGEVKSQGWIKDQRTLQGSAKYLAGGTEEYSELHESASYWYNANVPLAYVLDDGRLKSQSNQFLDYVLEHQAEDGCLGPETTRQMRGIWARCLLLQGIMNHAIADPAQEDKIVTAMHRFVVIASSMLKNNYTGFIQQSGDDFDPYGFGVARAHELSTTLQWLYETHPRGNQELIWETMNLVWSGTVLAKWDWTTFFVDGVFPTEGTPLVKVLSKFEHGVNMAQGLRYIAQLYRMTKNSSLVEQTRGTVNMPFNYQGSNSRTIIADEYIGGTSPQRGSELRMAVETMFSLSYLYRLIGDNSFADRAELAAFNVLPAMISPDFWSHQYVTQTNQPCHVALSIMNKHCQNLSSHLSSRQQTPVYSGILHLFLIPASVSTKIGGSDVMITCETSYPFGPVLKYTIDSKTSLNFYARIPEWVRPNSTIRINGGHKIQIPPGQTGVEITLEAEIRILSKPNNTVAIYDGALLYALDIGYNTTASPVRNWSSHEPIPANETDPRALALPNPIYACGAPLLAILAAAQEIEWPEAKGTADLPPDPVTLVGSPFWAKLVPYGSAKLHMGELPSVVLPKLEL
ncbi:hypothetical protein BDZ45DRAFT_786199 [Acephala macrosclerotiorum]|nr:hypothetical protein BDZ45DRAFT_786199 [Acephala macrosclerotiorum]